MYQSLVPCPGCSRHVRVEAEAACPFCGTALPSALSSRIVPSPTGRLSRSALFVFATTVAAAGCSGAVDPSQDSSTTDAFTSDTFTSDEQTVAPPYGVAPPQDSGAPDDAGGASADYGAPALLDAGH